MCPKNKGFTLIELLIAVTIMGIIAAIAYPSFVDHMRKSKRAEAHAELLRLAEGQERFYLQNNTYTSNIANVGNRLQTEYGYYDMAIDAADATGFTLSATAVGSQADDVECPVITLNSAGQKLPQECW